ncbi:hypothetical protein K400107F7_23950 [Agathobaculum massiliense]
MKLLITGGAGFIGGNFVHYMMNKYPDYQLVLHCKCRDDLPIKGAASFTNRNKC